MNPRTPSPIKRIIRKRLDIDTLPKFLLVCKNHYSKAQTVSLNLNDGEMLLNYFKFADIKKVLTKLFDLLPSKKSIKRLDLRKDIFPLCGRDNTKLIKQIKQYSHLKELGLPSMYERELYKSIEISTLWLRFTKRLEKLDCFLPDGFRRISKGTKKAICNRFLKSLKHSRLISFMVSPGHVYNNIPKKILDFSRYPKSLKELALRDQGFCLKVTCRR